MSRTSALTRKPKGLGRRNFTQGYPRSHATATPTSRSKGQKSRSRGGAYCGGHLAAQLVILQIPNRYLAWHILCYCSQLFSCLAASQVGINVTGFATWLTRILKIGNWSCRNSLLIAGLYDVQLSYRWRDSVSANSGFSCCIINVFSDRDAHPIA